ncbi:hypothetical protein CYMTET_23161, partial [Cymbomonas tetramitiformis]
MASASVPEVGFTQLHVAVHRLGNPLKPAAYRKALKSLETAVTSSQANQSTQALDVSELMLPETNVRALLKPSDVEDWDDYGTGHKLTPVHMALFLPPGARARIPVVDVLLAGGAQVDCR